MILTTVPHQDASHLDQPQVVGGLLLVTHQDGPALRKPAQSSLHHPAPRRIALLSGRVLLLLADLADMRRVAVTFDHFPSRQFVVALVQTQVLGDLLGGLRALDHNGLESGLQELEIRHVRSGHNHRKRAAVGLDKYRAFDSVLGPISGVRAYEVPPKRALPIAPSAACHSKSTPPSSSHSSMSLSQMRSNTPSSTHLWKVRCTDESSGNSFGIWFHWQPVLIQKMRLCPGLHAGLCEVFRCFLVGRVQ